MTDLTPHLQNAMFEKLGQTSNRTVPIVAQAVISFLHIFIHFPPGLNLSIPVKKGKSFFPILIKEHLHICTSAPCTPLAGLHPSLSGGGSGLAASFPPGGAHTDDFSIPHYSC